jgi:hypothetical protein
MTEFNGVVDVLKNRTREPPPLLYKYCAFNERTPTIFQNNELYFQSPNCFNDPFDTAVGFTCVGSKQQRKRLFREHMPLSYPHLSRKEALRLERRFKGGHWDHAIGGMEKQLQKIRERMGVFCMTEKKDNILMWSHYAKWHTGFCLEFETDDLFFSQVHPVEYTSTLPCVNLPDAWDTSVGSHTEGLLTKAKEWEYEREWRIIDLKNGVGVHLFPPAILHGVILGCRISEEDRQQVVEWCKGRSPRPTLCQARKKKMEYGLDIEPMPY